MLCLMLRFPKVLFRAGLKLTQHIATSSVWIQRFGMHAARAPTTHLNSPSLLSVQARHVPSRTCAQPALQRPLQRQYRLRLAATPVPSRSASFSGLRVAAPQNGSKWHCSRWLDNSAQVDVDVPLEDCWQLWEDRERIPSWMPWISSVTVQKDNPNLSRWTLSTYQFERQWEFSWLALNMTPMKYQKIHWRSVPGSVGGSLGSGIELQNRGQIRFFRKSPTSCTVKLTISYEVPNVLAPFASLLTPVVENVLQTDLKRFAQYALQHSKGAKS